MVIDWRALPSLSALRAFDAAAARLSFSAAARSLNVTPAAISQQVRSLESELGLVLVRRQGRGIALTEHGVQLARSLEQGFGAISHGVETLREGERNRAIRVTTTPSIVDEFLLSHMAEFWQKHPGVEVSLTPGESYVDIVRDGFDLAIRGGEGHYPGLHVEHLVDTRWIAAAAPKWIHGKQVDLQQLPWIANTNLEWEIMLLNAAGLHPDQLDIVNLGDPRHSVRAAREGFGATIANAFIVRRDLASGDLRAIELDSMPPMAYWAVTPPGSMRPILADFIAWLKEVFQREASKYPPAAGRESVRGHRSVSG